MIEKKMNLPSVKLNITFNHTISNYGFGNLPDSIHIYWEDKEKSGKVAISQENEVYHHTFTGVKRDIRYWAEYPSPRTSSPRAISAPEMTAFGYDPEKDRWVDGAA